MPTITRTAASLIAVVAVSALALYIAYGGSDTAPSATPSPSPGVTPTPAHPTSETPRVTPPPTPSPTPPPNAIEISGEAALPDGVALILETGCWGCDGPASGLRRIYRDSSGDIRVEQLLSVDQLGLEPVYGRDPGGNQYLAGPYITGIAVAQDASDMLVSVCIAAACGGGGLIGWSEDARVAVFRSTDGGVTWHSLGEYDDGLALISPTGPGSALVYWYPQPPSERGPNWPAFALFPAMQPIEPPGEGYFPVFTVGTDVVWQRYDEEDGRLVRTDGSVFVDLGENARAYARPGRHYESGETIPLLWSTTTPAENGPPRTESYLSLVSTDGDVMETMPLPADLLYAPLLFHEGLIYGNVAYDLEKFGIQPADVFYGQLPAIIELESDRMFAVYEHIRRGVEPSRDTLHAIQRGPFARVVNTGGTCLNVRDAPRLNSNVLACAAEGVLLRYDPSSADDVAGWLAVRTPGGVSGWASTQYLEYASQ